MEKEKIDYSKLISAFKTLEASIEKLNENKNCDFADMLEDSCVQRFEYTLETAWKLMKRILKKVYGKNDAELTVNNIFRFMQGYNFIPDWENWKNYYSKRNDTSHEYDIEKSRELIKIIPDFIKDTKIFIENLENFFND